MKHKKTDSSAVDSTARAPDEQPGDTATADSDLHPATPPANPEAAPRTGDHREQVKVWEEEGGSPPEQISSTSATKPKTASKAGSMGAAKD